MSEPVWEQLTLSQEDSPASRFPWLESKKDGKMIVTSGRKCSGLSESLSRVGWSVRTYLESCELPLPTLYRTWSVKDLTSSCLILKLRLSGRTTVESESRLWPTPIAGHCGMTATTGGRPIEKSTHLQTQVMLEEKKRLYPTPKAQNCRGNGERHGDGGPSLDVVCGGQLNPTWVEWLMGFPTGWTELSASETPYVRRSSSRSSKQSQTK